jgi:hypothetical protein
MNIYGDLPFAHSVADAFVRADTSSWKSLSVFKLGPTSMSMSDTEASNYILLAQGPNSNRGSNETDPGCVPIRIRTTASNAAEGEEDKLTPIYKFTRTV